MSDRTNNPVGQRSRALFTLKGPLASARSRFSNALVWGGLAYGAIALVFTVVVFWNHWTLISVAFFVGLASVGVGCVMRFLFGIPKLAEEGITRAQAAQGGQVAVTSLLFNTNLGQISDWVTKIVVGLGIAQFGEVLDGANWLAIKFGDVFAPTPLSSSAASTYGLSLVIAGVTISFLLMYMWTATRLPEVWGPTES